MKTENKNHLRTIATAYERAEVTCIFLDNKQTNQKINLFTLFELIPAEQQSSPTIGNAKSFYLQREFVDKTYTLYITRLIDLTIAEAIDKYENIESGIKLKYNTLDVNVEISYSITQEPPDYFDLLITSSEEKTLGRILPKRNTSFRVWSKLNTDKEWLKEHDKKLLEKITKLSREHLGYDLSSIPEHIGNIYLCACNPILRKWGVSLLDKKKDLLVSFHEREGKSIIGCKLVLQEDRSKNIGFVISHEIKSNEERISLPYFPAALHESIYNANGQLIEYSYGVWVNFHVNMHIQESVLNLNVQTSNGIEVHSIPKTSMGSKITIGEIDLSTARYLREALNSRKFEELESSKEFVFFPKHENSKSKAQATVRELLNKANKRCMILDPYFGAPDLFYALTIQNISFPIQIISSGMFLSREINNEIPKKRNKLQKLWLCITNATQKQVQRKTYANQLNESIKQYGKQYPLQKIQCKVLRGAKSPLHDRYIIVDEEVYLLGSSLNEFGNRATTIIKVPAPIKMIEQATSWWDSDKECPFLEEYITKKEE